MFGVDFNCPCPRCCFRYVEILSKVCTVSSNKEEAAAIPPSLKVPTSDIILDEDFTTAILCWLCETPGCPYWTSYERWWKGVCVRCRPLVGLWRIHPCSRGRGSRSPLWFLILDISLFFCSVGDVCPVLSALLQAHPSQPFQSLSNILSFTAYSSLLFSFRHHLYHYLAFGREWRPQQIGCAYHLSGWLTMAFVTSS